MATLQDITVPYTRLMDATSGNADENGVIASCVFKTTPKDSWTFLRQCRGGLQQFGSLGGIVYRLVPLQFPENTDLYAYRGQIDYKGAKQGLFPDDPYGWARIKIDFQFPTFNPNEDEWTTYSTRTAANFITIPHRVYAFADGTRTGQDVGRLLPEQEALYVRHWVPDLTVIKPLIYALSGRVNSAVFDGQDPGTQLFMGGDTNVAISTLGNTLSQDVQLTFRFRSVPWNYCLHPDGLTGYAPVFDAGSNLIYPDDSDVHITLPDMTTKQVTFDDLLTI